MIGSDFDPQCAVTEVIDENRVSRFRRKFGLDLDGHVCFLIVAIGKNFERYSRAVAIFTLYEKFNYRLSPIAAKVMAPYHRV